MAWVCDLAHVTATQSQTQQEGHIAQGWLKASEGPTLQLSGICCTRLAQAGHALLFSSQTYS